MKMLKKYLLPLTLLLLVIIAYIYKKQDSTLGKYERNISFTAQEETNYIEITNSKSSVKLFKNSNNKWLAEDKTEINNAMISELFSLLENIQIHSSVPSEKQNEYKKKITEKGTLISCYSGKKLNYQLNFYNSNNKNILKTKKNNAFYFTIRGYGDELLSKYVKTNTKYWYNKVLLNLEPNEIKHILLQYPKKQENGFIIDNNSTTPKLLNMQNSEINNSQKQSILDYLSFFSGITYNYIDTIAYAANPKNHLFQLEIETKDNKLFHIEGFEVIKNSTQTADINNFAGIVNNSLAVMLKYSDFDPILVEQDYFIKK